MRVEYPTLHLPHDGDNERVGERTWAQAHLNPCAPQFFR